MDSIRNSTPRSRQNSTTTIPKPSLEAKLPKDTPSITSISKARYTVFIRLPFPRDGFEDPPPVEWDLVKDKALWKLFSTASNSKELDWQEMSRRFDVSLPFLLQQAAWLYECHFDAMRAQMKKFNVSSAAVSGTATPAPEGGVRLDGSAAVGGVAMSRGGSKDSTSTSAVNTQKQRPLSHGETESAPPTPRPHRFLASRTPSANTVRQTRMLASPRPLSSGTGTAPGKQLTPRLPKESPKDNDDAGFRLGIEKPTQSDSEEETSMVRSKAFSRPPLHKKDTTETLSWDGDAEDDEEDSSGDLPFAAPSNASKEDPAATIRDSTKRQDPTSQATATATTRLKLNKEEPTTLQNDSSQSSSNSAQQPQSTQAQPRVLHTGGPQSPRHRAELEKLSPRSKKSGSDDSPSIGSSFSDLDDVSVAQSALEEALMSNMRYGSIGMGVGSRVSNLRDALGR